jgi:hypothetical protein
VNKELSCMFYGYRATKSQFVIIFGGKALIQYCDRCSHKVEGRGFLPDSTSDLIRVIQIDE